MECLRQTVEKAKNRILRWIKGHICSHFKQVQVTQRFIGTHQHMEWVREEETNQTEGYHMKNQ